RICECRKRAHAWPDVRPRGQDPATSGLNALQRVRYAIDHDVGSSALVGSPVAFFDPRSADATAVVEGQRTVATLPHLPAENAAVEIRGDFGRLRRYFQVTRSEARRVGKE